MNIQKVTHPFLAQLSKNLLEVFHNNIAILSKCNKWVSFNFEPPNRLFPSGAIWIHVREKTIDWAFDGLAIWWRNAVDRFEFQDQEQIVGSKNKFPKFGFLTVKFFLVKKNYQYPYSNSPLFGRIVKKRVGSFSQRYCRFGRPRKVIFLYWPFLGPFATSPTRYGPKMLPDPKIVNETFAKWWRNAVYRLEVQSQENVLGP